MLSRNIWAVKLDVFQIDAKVSHSPLGLPITKPNLLADYFYEDEISSLKHFNLSLKSKKNTVLNKTRTHAQVLKLSCLSFATSR